MKLRHFISLHCIAITFPRTVNIPFAETAISEITFSPFSSITIPLNSSSTPIGVGSK